MRVALITAIYGGHDKPKPLPLEHGFDEAILVSDSGELSAEGWTSRAVPRGAMSPRLASKLPKMQPFDYVDADIAVWLDGSFSIDGPGFRDFCVDSLADYDLVTWAHPDREKRDCLYLEALECQHWPKYNDYPIPAQTAHYRAEGMPEGFGLWACGTIAWRNTPEAREFGRLWLIENMRWSIQDQVSLPYLVWKHRPRLGEFAAHEYDNPYLTWHHHESEL